MPSAFLPSIRIFGVVLLAASAMGGAQASSTALSASSDSASSTASSASDSFKGSSNASSPGGRQASGEFRVVEVAEAPARVERVRLHLEPLEGNASPAFTVELPRAAIRTVALARGDVVVARQRPFGVEFAAARPGEPAQTFFLVLDDDWHRELATRPVSL